jgi:hypothetical protein
MLIDYFYNETVFKFLIWAVISALGYLISFLNTKKIRMSARCSSCMSKWCITDGNYFDVGHFNKTSQEWAYSVAYTLLIGSCHFYFANVVNRIEFEWINLLYVLPIYITIVGFGYLGELKGAQTSCSSSSIKNWPMMSKVLYSIAFILLFVNLGFHLYLAYLDKTIFWYVMFIAAAATIIAVSYKIVKKQDSLIDLHIHHWFIGFMGGLLFRFNHPISIVSYGICYGLILEEAVVYGLDSIFSDT